VSAELPGHLSPRSVSQTFAKALHAPAFVLLGGCLITAISLQAQNPGATLWPALAAALLMVASLALLDRWRTRTLAYLYLLVGGFGAYVYMRTLAAEFDPARLSDDFIVVMPAAALILIGGSGTGAAAGLRWAGAGFIVAQGVAFLAVWETRGDATFSLTPLALYLGITVVLGLQWFSRRGDWRAQPRLGVAERAEYLAAIRRRAELEAAALTHDTILNHLAVISTSPTGPPSTALYDQLELDLAALARVDLSGLDPSIPAKRGGPPAIVSAPVAAGTAAAPAPSPATVVAAEAAGATVEEAAAPQPPTSTEPSDDPWRLPTSLPPGYTAAPHKLTQELRFPATWQGTPLFGAIQAARERGLTVVRTGDPVPVAQLDDQAAAALGQAVTACLTNVEQHSGVSEVEVAIDASDTDLVVLVIDAGAGFTPADVPNDRLGIKSSVRGRIEAAHGTVAVWSSPGQGTSVILRLPLVATPKTGSLSASPTVTPSPTTPTASASANAKPTTTSTTATPSPSPSPSPAP
jgi:hypothetical protein